MKFTFSDSAIEYILKQINKSNENTYDIIIDYADGNSPYNENISGCHCQVYDKYRVLIVSKNDVNIKTIRKQKNKIEKEIEQEEQNVKELFLQKGQISKELSSINEDVSKLSKIVSVDESDSKKDILASELIESINDFLIALKVEKKISLEEKIKIILNNLMHKDDFVNRVEIIVNEDMLDINLYDKEESIINKGKLSKGEQQLYASSLLQAFIEESQMKFPIFIDSPLQKFDKIHANKIITEFYPVISEQVILFPLLGKELSKKEFEIMKPYINSVYKIKNQTDFSYIEKLSDINNLIS